MEELEFDWSVVDKQFAVPNQSLTKKSPLHTRSLDAKSSLFESKRIQNVEIARSKLRRTVNELYELILFLDPIEFTQDIKEIIVNLLLPTDDELETIRSYQGSIDDLDFCGTLYYKLLSIERLHARIVVHDIICNFFQELTAIIDNLSIIRDAITELRAPKCEFCFKYWELHEWINKERSSSWISFGYIIETKN